MERPELGVPGWAGYQADADAEPALSVNGAYECEERATAFSEEYTKSFVASAGGEAGAWEEIARSVAFAVSYKEPDNDKAWRRTEEIILDVLSS